MKNEEFCRNDLQSAYNEWAASVVSLARWGWVASTVGMGREGGGDTMLGKWGLKKNPRAARGRRGFFIKNCTY